MNEGKKKRTNFKSLKYGTLVENCANMENKIKKKFSFYVM